MAFLSLVGGDEGLFSKEALKEVSVGGPALALEFCATDGEWLLLESGDVGVDDRKLFWFPCLGCGGDYMGQRAEFPCTSHRIYVAMDLQGLMCRGSGRLWRRLWLLFSWQKIRVQQVF
ncbi:hypothetical protein SLA2020_080100 [Shorea laevis]